jgi:hypothetical protein
MNNRYVSGVRFGEDRPVGPRHSNSSHEVEEFNGLRRGQIVPIRTSANIPKKVRFIVGLHERDLSSLQILGLGDKTSISKDGENEAEMICENQSRPIAQILTTSIRATRANLAKSTREVVRTYLAGSSKSTQRNRCRCASPCRWRPWPRPRQIRS